MTVYHGSVAEIVDPHLSQAKKRLDFGKAFYLTSFRRQAEKWAKRTAIRTKRIPVVNVYDLSDDLSKYRVLDFGAADELWLDFVCACRAGKTAWRGYDVIRGRVANDDVFKTVEAFLQGDITKEVALRDLSYAKPNDQIALVTSKAIKGLLTFKRSYVVEV